MEVCIMVTFLLSAPNDLMTLLLHDINIISPCRYCQFHVNAHERGSKDCQQWRPPQ